MKNIIKIKSALIILAVLAIMFNITETYAGNKTTKVNVPTIQCGMCEKTIKSVLKKIDGVNKVTVDLENKVVTVKYNDAKTNLEAIENAITAAGYNANDKVRDAEAYEKLHECCKER